jgi:hypothetical protein
VDGAILIEQIAAGAASKNDQPAFASLEQASFRNSSGLVGPLRCGII